MRHRLSSVIVSLAAVSLLVSCAGKDEFHATPTITLSQFYCNPVLDGSGKVVSAEDSLGWRYNEADDSYILDTLAMKDSTLVLFAAAFMSHGNNLVSAIIEYDTAQLRLQPLLGSEIMAVTVAPTDTAARRLYFTPGFNIVSFPIYYTPRVKGNLPLTLTVHSDAGSEYSPASLRLVQPVK